MFNIGDEVIVKNTDKKGIVTGMCEGKEYCTKIYGVKIENSSQIHTESDLMLASTVSKTETTTNYDIKSDQNKPQLHLVPISQLWTAIARVREYGVNKYGDNNSWKKVELKRYHDALLRHTAAITMDLNSIDEESGLPHRWHIACNLAFIEALMEER